MVQVEFIREGIIVRVPKGTTILDAARQAGVQIESPCNGSLVCGKCRLENEAISPISAIALRRDAEYPQEAPPTYVLACASCLIGDARVETRVKEAGTMDILTEGQGIVGDIESPLRKVYMPDMGFTRVFLDNKLACEEAGDTSDECYGVAVDIGTTTLVCALVDLSTGAELATEASLNPQTVYGQDVLSRIKFASNAVGLTLLHDEITSEIDRLIGVAAERINVPRNRVYEIVFCGNTCMLHLALHVDPSPLGRYPYLPEWRGDSYEPAQKHGIEISPIGRIYLPPVISAYVGADITAGLIAANLLDEERTVLFIDIGTNGEMMISRKRKLTATSTAAGPAFEGMNIAFGMRAAPGAIEAAEFNPDDGLSIRTIGGKEPIGICGSGLVDVVGILVSQGIIRQSGRFANEKELEKMGANINRLGRVGKENVFYLSDNVYLSQKDVRQLQLAKGAIRAGIEILLAHLDIRESDVDVVKIAGSFGYHLKPTALTQIGLLPDAFKEKIEFVGNTSKIGGRLFLLNRRYRERMRESLARVDVLELSDRKDFQEVFVRCLGM
jgi:uncharacterized 2Fe-2S/4Fe-4S cluster protein (DUF4445 family)